MGRIMVNHPFDPRGQDNVLLLFDKSFLQVIAFDKYDS